MPTTNDYAVFANQLGEFYMDTAEELGDYLDATIDDAGDPKALQLADQIDQISVYANRLFELADKIAFDALTTDLQGVKAGIANINQALRTIANIDKAIAIATVILQLGAAIVTQNGSGLVTALQTIASI